MTIIRRLQLISRRCTSDYLLKENVRCLYKEVSNLGRFHTPVRHASTDATTTVFQDTLRVPLPCYLRLNLNSAANVRLVPGKMEELSVEVVPTSKFQSFASFHSQKTISCDISAEYVPTWIIKIPAFVQVMGKSMLTSPGFHLEQHDDNIGAHPMHAEAITPVAIPLAHR